MADVRRLPGPVADYWDWQLSAACRDVGDDLFFHPEAERGASRTTREAAAKAICARCPVIAQCFRAAILAVEPYGVWGGTTEDERALLLDRDQAAAGDRTV